jgi:hypothetical protein
MVIDPWAYRLKPYLWTSDVAWCAILATISALLTRLHPRQRGLVVTLFLVPQVGQCLPYLRSVLTDWLREPGNPIWFFSLVWFSIFTFIVIPFSIVLGGVAACGFGGKSPTISTVAGTIPGLKSGTSESSSDE